MHRLVVAWALSVAGLIGASQPSSAVFFSVPGPTTTERALVTEVQYQGCRAWRRQCARRWGWRGQRYRRCVAWHGC